MDINFWLERWVSKQTGFHQYGVNPRLERFWQTLGLKKGGRVFVPLCGKSLDMRWLRELGYYIIGSEVSPLAVESFFLESGLTPEIQQGPRYTRWTHDGIDILCGDFFSLKPADIEIIDAFYDRAALIALTPAQRPHYARQLAELLGKDTDGLLVTIDYNQAEHSGPPFAVSATEVDTLFSDNFEIRQVFTCDALEDNPRFKERGLTGLTENVFHLKRR